ncbi:hypothetical protein [Ornithinimicrobium avium]|uniref:hypothetical protein n=1 Tax=Ornithinimicrobium avium TaxID=2283195 RepID=UPI00192DCD06|nr:hypothetical protein [Ornithinimicrobium avium]
MLGIEASSSVVLVALEQVLGGGGRGGAVGTEEGEQVDRDPDASAGTVGQALGEATLLGCLAHAAQHLPVREPADQRRVISVQVLDDDFDPGGHPFQVDVERGQYPDGGEQGAQVVVGTIAGQGPEGVMVDGDLSAGHPCEQRWTGAGLLGQPPDPGLWTLRAGQFLEEGHQAGVDLAGGGVGEQVGETLPQHAPGAAAVGVRVVLAAALLAGEDRVRPGARRTHEDAVLLPGQRPHLGAAGAGTGVVVPTAPAAHAQRSVRQPGQAPAVLPAVRARTRAHCPA